MRALLLCSRLLSLLIASSATAAQILVYDENSVHDFASNAALAVDPTRVVGNASNFNSLLTSQSWAAVLIDAPSTIPAGGWSPTINYVNGGGRVAMSFWDWDNDAGQGNPGLLAAFGLTSATSFSLTGRTLTDTGATDVFLGVSMPNSDWHDHWVDDGDGFSFGLGSGTIGMANLSGVAGPVMALGNSSRTIAAFVIDEAGTTWVNDGSGVRLWQNMYAQIVPEPGSMTLLAGGLLALGWSRVRRRRDSVRSGASRFKE